MTLDDRTDQTTATSVGRPVRTGRPSSGRKARKGGKARGRTEKSKRCEKAEKSEKPEKPASRSAGQDSRGRPPSARVSTTARMVESAAPRWALDEPAARRHSDRAVWNSAPHGAAPEQTVPEPTDSGTGSVSSLSAETSTDTGTGGSDDGGSQSQPAPSARDTNTPPDTSASSETSVEPTTGGAGRQHGESVIDPAATAFDLLYATHAAALVRQTFLLTGNREVSRWSVDRAFHTAWEQWPRVATDPDPAGWVRSAAHEYALTPWLRMWPGHRAPDRYDGLPCHRTVLEAFWGLPRAYRRTLLLHDALGLSLADVAAETEASTPAARGRLRHGREVLAALVPEIATVDRPPEWGPPSGEAGGGELVDRDARGVAIGELLERAASTLQVRPRASPAVRVISEHFTRRWTVGACGLTAALVVATSFTIATTESKHSLLPTELPAALAQLAR